MYKAIVSDFDGTLATTDKRVTEENLKAIDELFSVGKKFALSTGRMTASAMMLIEKLPFKPLIATYNGSEVIDSSTGEVLVSHKLSTDILLKLMPSLHLFRCIRTCFSGTKIEKQKIKQRNNCCKCIRLIYNSIYRIASISRQKGLNDCITKHRCI